MEGGSGEELEKLTDGRVYTCRYFIIRKRNILALAGISYQRTLGGAMLFRKALRVNSANTKPMNSHIRRMLSCLPHKKI